MKEYSSLQKAFDPELFRSQGHALIDQLADLIQHTQLGNGPVIQPNDPDELLKYWEDLPALSTANFYQKIIEKSIKLHHPKCIGHQVSSPAPLGALSSLLSATLNNGMGVYEMGESATAIERIVAGIFCRALGYSQGDGILTSGGTLANLTALLCARANYQEINIWSEGTSEPYCVMVSDMAHYCVDRAVRIMGWGAEGIIRVPVNKKYQMDTSALPHLLQKARDKGKKILAIVGSAPCTGTGSHDNLNDIGDFCEKENIWFHLDAAHGGPAIFSDKYRYLMKGSEKADSVVIDAHKMMLTPALATALLFKRSSDSYRTFSQKAFYLWESQEEQEWHNLARRTFECTKHMMSVKLYSIINEFGIDIFGDFITRQYDLARDFADLLGNQSDFTLAVEPESNIVCFRYNPESYALSHEELSDVNRKIRKIMFEDGTFYLVQTELDNGLHLRVTLMNVFTTLEHLDEMLDKIRSVAQKIQVDE